MYIVGKYLIYLYELYKQVEQRVFGDLFWFVSQRVQISFTLIDNVRIFCLFCKNFKTTDKLSEACAVLLYFDGVLYELRV